MPFPLFPRVLPGLALERTVPTQPEPVRRFTPGADDGLPERCVYCGRGWFWHGDSDECPAEPAVGCPAPNPARESWVPPDRSRWPSLAKHRAYMRALARITGSEDA